MTCKKTICHENKPVAVREKLFKILTRAHKACHHGGRDKTSAQVRRVYSWCVVRNEEDIKLTAPRVPKELISRFVKMCPTCRVRRPSRDEPHHHGDDTTPPSDEDMPDSPISRRGSEVDVKRGSMTAHAAAGFSSTFAQQNRWMTDLPTLKTKSEGYDTMPPTTTYAGPGSPSALSPQYSSRLSDQLNAMSFPTSDFSTPGGFPSSNVRSTANWQSVNTPYDAGYPQKQERGGRVKHEHY
jgi:hypothetical protein